MKDDAIICDEFMLLIYIHECELKNKPVWFGMLLENSKWDRSKLSRIIDKLFDYAMLDGHWERVDGSWKRTFTVNEDFEGFIIGLYNTMEKIE